MASIAYLGVLAAGCCGIAAAAVRAEFDRGRAPDSLPQQHILMMLSRPRRRQLSLQQFIHRQYQPGNRDFHHWLTPQEFGAYFGPPAEDILTVTHWLTQHGFTVNQVPSGGLFVDFSGTAGQVAQAFHTEIHHYQVKGQDHYANTVEPSIPAELTGLVSGLRSLNDFHSQAHVHTPGIAHLDRGTGKWQSDGHLTAAVDPLYIAGPQDYARIYGVDQVWRETVNARPGAPAIRGAGQTIAVVGEANLDSADIQTFRDEFGITALGPHGSVEMENPPASVCAAPDPANNEPEGYLDAEWAGAMAPDATVDYVSCGYRGFTLGSDLAAAYVINDPAHVQRVSVLSTSYSYCETQPLAEANQFYVSLWQQAAVEGITVVVASGDTGGDSCTDVFTYAKDGLSALNEASTPYNIAAGGTDFSDVFSGTASTYWAPRNGADYLSAQSYIPEMAWNESCGSPLVLAAFGQGFTSSSGPNGFCTWAAQQPMNPLTSFAPYANAFAGGGGLSTVSARPEWQTGVPGIPRQPGRAVPDISMFAAGGYTWSQTLILCDSALADLPPGTACDFTNADDVYAGYAGGTSFVAPAFAGIMALINQKSGDRQGQANYVLYPLAGEQYVQYASASQPSLANCAAYLGPQVLGGCYFHDVSATPIPGGFISGNTAVPCTATASSPGVFSEDGVSNCYGYQITVTGNGGALTTTPDYFGVLGTAADSPAFESTPGYDLATGLGSPNVFSLVNAPQWSGGGLTTQVALAVNSGQTIRLEATVTDQERRAPVLGGTVIFYSGNTALGSVTRHCSRQRSRHCYEGGHFGLQISSATLGGIGTYPNVFASYRGGAQRCRNRKANYYGSHSASATVVVDQGDKGRGL